MFILGLAVVVWAGCLVAARRSADEVRAGTVALDRTTAGWTPRLAVVAACGLLFVVLPTVEFAVFALFDLIYGPRLWAPIIGLLATVPLGTGVVLFRRSLSRGGSFGSSLTRAVLGGVVSGVLLLLWGVIATAATGM